MDRSREARVNPIRNQGRCVRGVVTLCVWVNAAFLPARASALPPPDEADTGQLPSPPPSDAEAPEPSVPPEEAAAPTRALTVAVDPAGPPNSRESPCPPPPSPTVCSCQSTPAPEPASSGEGESFLRQMYLILSPLGIFLKGWEVSALHLVRRGEVGATGVAAGSNVPLLGPMRDFGAVGGFTAYVGGGGHARRVGSLGAMSLRLGLGLRTSDVVFALQGVGGISGWREQIPASAEGGAELATRWMMGEFGPVLHFFARPTWLTSRERRAASRLQGPHELTAGMRVSVSSEIPIAASVSYTETMGTQLFEVGFGSGMLDWIVDYDR
jgi:hypothetical protein